MNINLTDNFDVSQKYWLDFYAMEILKSEGQECFSQESLQTIKAELASQINFNDVSKVEINSLKYSKPVFPKVLLIEDRASFAYAHVRMIKNIGADVSHIWNQYDALNADYSQYNLIIISESIPSINSMLLMYFIKLIPFDKRPIVFLILDKCDIGKCIDLLASGINHVIKRPVKFNELIKSFEKFDLSQKNQNKLRESYE